MTKRPLFQLLTPVLSAILLTGLALAYPTLAGAHPPAQGTNAWIIWEMAQPPQSLLLDGDTLAAAAARRVSCPPLV